MIPGLRGQDFEVPPFDQTQQERACVPVWVSTAGAGVSWLHVRLDDRPKYYGYQPYRNLEDQEKPWAESQS